MEKKNTFKGFAYVPKIWATIVYFLFFIFAVVLFMGRKAKWQMEFITNSFPEFYSHISNFSISFMLILVAGYVGVLQLGKLTSAFILAGIGILANLVYEFYIPILNTPDPIDAYFGILGCLMPFLFLIPYQKFGIQKKSIA